MSLENQNYSSKEFVTFPAIHILVWRSNQHVFYGRVLFKENVVDLDGARGIETGSAKKTNKDCIKNFNQPGICCKIVFFKKMNIERNF